ncbi:Uncharacterised protein [Mycobacteroides abscessus]|nr:Uncharacterised protein [Mycobacteroides abscessus]
MTNEPPSNTRSSWPPTRFTYATGALTSRARRAARSVRTCPLPSSYGEPLSTSSRSSPLPASSSVAISATGPPSCQMSSQIAMPTRRPSTSTTVVVSPGAKMRNSSNTP